MGLAGLTVAGADVGGGVEFPSVGYRLPEDRVVVIDLPRLAPHLAVVGIGDETCEHSPLSGRIIKEETFLGREKLRITVIGQYVQVKNFAPLFRVA